MFESGVAGASMMGVIFPPTPDGISSSVIIEELLSQRGIESEFIVSAPEGAIEAVENCSGRCDSMMFLELPPHGKGPIQVSEELYKGVIVLDHGSTPILGRKTVRINLDIPGVSTSLLSYFIAVSADESNDLLSWVASAGFLGKCGSPVCYEVLERARLSWPELADEGALRMVQESLAIASFLGEDWIYLVAAALRESLDDPDWFISGTSATASLIRSKVGEVMAELRSLIEDPTLRHGDLLGWEVPEPHQRFVISLMAKEMGARWALSYFYDPPLGLVYIMGDSHFDLFTASRRAMGDIQGSVFGGRGFSSIIVDSERMGDVVESLARILHRGSGTPAA